MAQHIPTSGARYKLKVTTRVKEYSADKDPAVDEPDRVIEGEPQHWDPEDFFPRRDDHANDK